MLSDPRRTNSTNTASHSEQNRTQPPVPPILNSRSAEITIEGGGQSQADTQTRRQADTQARRHPANGRRDGSAPSTHTCTLDLTGRSQDNGKVHSPSWWAWRDLCGMHPSLSLSLSSLITDLLSICLICECGLLAASLNLPCITRTLHHLSSFLSSSRLAALSTSQF